MSEYAIQLYKVSERKLVDAILIDEVTNEHLEQWQNSWVPLMRAHCEGRERRDRPEDHHWNWKAKSTSWRRQLGYHSFAIVCEDALQGMMWLNDLKSARLQSQFGKPLAYVEFLATAPWNRPEIEASPRFKGVGSVFVGAAIEFSRYMDYKGRIALHSLPAAIPFYRDACGMTELGPDSAHQDLVYFEMTAKQAEAYRREG